MAKENVAKFFEKLASDKALTEKLAAADKDYAGKYEVKAGDDAAKKAAVEEILLPIAKEAGMPFTVEELMSVEQEKMSRMEGEISDDEMAQAAGGDKGYGACANACVFVGIGLGIGSKNKNRVPDNLCALLGVSDGIIASACWKSGERAQV